MSLMDEGGIEVRLVRGAPADRRAARVAQGQAASACSASSPSIGVTAHARSRDRVVVRRDRRRDRRRDGPRSLRRRAEPDRACTRRTAASSPSSRRAITCGTLGPVVREALARRGSRWDASTASPSRTGRASSGRCSSACRWRRGSRGRAGCRSWASITSSVTSSPCSFVARGEAEPAPEFPFVALLASGGHTAIYRVDGPTRRARPRARRDARRRGGRGVRQGREAARPRVPGRPGDRSPRGERATRRRVPLHAADGSLEVVRAELLRDQDAGRRARARARAPEDRERARGYLRVVPGGRDLGAREEAGRRGASRRACARWSSAAASRRTASSARA